MITLNLFFFNPIKKSPLLALLNLKRFEISPKNGWRALERGDEPTEAFPNWRRGRDSNPRGAYAPTGLANPGTRPLCDLSKNALFSIYFQKPFGGGEIRTHGRLTTTPVFKTGALNRYATPPSQD